LFSLPAELRYNFNPTANSRLGATHSDDTLAKMSEAKSGTNHPFFGKTHSPESRAQMSGPNHHMYGKVASFAMTINVYSLANVLVRSFSSQVDAANWLNIPSFRTTFLGYLSSGKVWNNQYVFRKSVL